MAYNNNKCISSRRYELSAGKRAYASIVDHFPINAGSKLESLVICHARGLANVRRFLDSDPFVNHDPHLWEVGEELDLAAGVCKKSQCGSKACR
jgi:hypothetical protein